MPKNDMIWQVEKVPSTKRELRGATWPNKSTSAARATAKPRRGAPGLGHGTVVLTTRDHDTCLSRFFLLTYLSK